MPTEVLELTLWHRKPRAHRATKLRQTTQKSKQSWKDKNSTKPIMKAIQADPTSVIEAAHSTLGNRWLYCESLEELLFTENETNYERLFGVSNPSPYVKDGINNCVVHDQKSAVNPQQTGTKASIYYLLKIGAGQEKIVRLRLSDSANLSEPFGINFNEIFTTRKQEADEFYQRISPGSLLKDARNVQRQAFAGMLWTKQFYHYVVEDWLQGDPAGPPPERHSARIKCIS